MLWTILILIVIVAVLIAIGLAVGFGSRAARRRGADESTPPAEVKVIERH